MKQFWSLQAVILCSYCFHLLYGNSAGILYINITLISSLCARSIAGLSSSYSYHTLSILAAVLTSDATVVCPGDTITFTCSVRGDNVTWAVYTPPGFAIAEHTIVVSDPISVISTSTGLRFQAVFTGISGGVITTILTNLNDISLGYGDTVACSGQDSADNLTITRPGKITIKSWCYKCTYL